MKKKYVLEGLDCPVCALKIEDTVRKMDGVQSVSVSFIGQTLVLEASDEEFDRVAGRMVKAVKRAEPDCCIHLK